MPPSATSTSPSNLYYAALDETLLWLCSMPSPIGEEREICDAVAERVSKMRLAGALRRYGDSLVVPVRRGSGGPHIALAGHLDTVRTENGPARIEGDRLFGAGSSDMKSGLAVMLVVAEAIGAQLGCDLTLVFYAREEGPYDDNELGVVLDRDQELGEVDLAVCLEPSDNRLQLGCNGSVHATITFTGRTAHSARPWQGDNAINRAIDVLADFAKIEPEPRELEGLTYKNVLTVTQAKDGGRGRNVVPDRFQLNVNHRFTPDETLETAMNRIKRIVAERGDVDFTDLSPAAPPSAHHPLVVQLIEAGVVAVEPKQAWTDVARFAARGIAAVNFGPGENAQAHQPHESTSLELVHEGFEIVRRWLLAVGDARAVGAT